PLVSYSTRKCPRCLYTKRPLDVTNNPLYDAEKMLNFFKNIGPTEIVVLVIIVLIFFGSKIAVKFGKASGETVREIKKIKDEFTGSGSKDKKEVSS
ncbi:MAG: twin-arginine translocase TatA/TatE family subunit, partial [Patescibacteria group bacterium]